MDSLNAFMDSTQQVVTGTVKLKLFKGGMMGAGSVRHIRCMTIAWPALPPVPCLTTRIRRAS
jgi:hypothetical protein